MREKIEQSDTKKILYDSFNTLTVELNKFISLDCDTPTVDIDEFLYSPDYLNLSPDPDMPIRLSERQREALIILDNDDSTTNQILEAVLIWGKGCLSGKSTIEDINGNKYTIEELEKIYKDNKDFKLKIKSYNEDSKMLEEDIVEDVWIKGIDDLYEVELENGKKIQVTLDHKFLTIEGWKTLRQLNEEDEIISCE